MNGIPLHPALVHIPLGIAFVLPVVALGLAVALWCGAIPRRSWLVVVALQAAVAAGGAVALRTGEQDEHRVERVVGKTALHDHEHAGKAFLWGATIALALTLVAAIIPARLATAAAVAAMLVVAALGYRAGKAGGELVYARGAAGAYAGLDAGTSAPEAREHHRDHRHR